VEIRFTCGYYKPCAVTHLCADSGIHRSNNSRGRSGIQRSCYWLVHRAGHNRPSDRDVAHGRRALDIVIYNETAGLVGGYFGVCLGGTALAHGARMGIGCDLAVLRFLMFVFKLAPAFMVAGDISHIMCSCFPELPAFYRSNCHAIDYKPALRSSSSRGINFRMAFPRCEMAFFSSLLNWATVFFRWGTKKIGS
jgi:hypothetical protein